MKSPNFSFKFVSHCFVQRLPLSGGLDQALISFWNPLNLYFKLKGERALIKAWQERIPSQHLPSVFRRGTGVGAMPMPSATPATSSPMTNLNGGGWCKAPVVLDDPAVRSNCWTPAIAPWGSSPCHNTLQYPAGSSQMSSGWAGVDVNAQLPSFYNWGGCLNLHSSGEAKETAYICGLYSFL